jgi:hypothetical protein
MQQHEFVWLHLDEQMGEPGDEEGEPDSVWRKCVTRASLLSAPLLAPYAVGCLSLARGNLCQGKSGAQGEAHHATALIHIAQHK